ncbi:competence type IV pilus ATPase ComGA [Alkalihalobacillus sp. AL-G]|uniref:competence type IV pilus ATPase ComGA n=1 Tax=Alkalihalobacillus sp. AL-G TaxID=2926399 RepID=UPI002729A786|nr:competence type IV pilus ATPase ComGA [Alkalihalobacillus sp. AL-G]WLD95421.1 GspE/PulE family protein [Alkalihalobacillus sp. AL-G]
MSVNAETKSEALLKRAISLGATDLHIVPKQRSALIQLRIDQRLYPLEEVPLSFSDRLISHFKFLSGMDIGEKRKPQNGAIHHYLPVNGNVHLRLSTLPSAYNEALAIRILLQEEKFHFTHLSVFPNILKQIYSLLHKPQGLLLFAGPTGSGKTTLLYSLLKEMQLQKKRQVITLEDPIEKKMDTVLQIEINEPAGVTYFEGFKSILRHDPDVIMIGEIRDEATAQLAIRASLTGHLVLSTLHAKNTIGCLYRLNDFGVHIEDLRQTLLGIVSQRLYELSCPYCGDTCSLFCMLRRQHRRMGVYELLNGPLLQTVMNKVQTRRPVSTSFPKVEDYLMRAIAMGYIPESHSDSVMELGYEKT